MRPRSVASFYHIGGRSWSRDEILQHAQFDRHEREMPGVHLVVMLQIIGSSFNTRIIRFDPKPDEPPPFWRHGEIMEMRIELKPKPGEESRADL